MEYNQDIFPPKQDTFFNFQRRAWETSLLRKQVVPHPSFIKIAGTSMTHNFVSVSLGRNFVFGHKTG